ncbi:hypothetical protein AC249_AIPGENE10540 [Exaiptasia diaphana]|nr:hypothetical protein AC249_AIPGENE10540 [Exaiptasia diaphana]
MLFKEDVKKTASFSGGIYNHNYTSREDGIWPSFKRHFIMSNVVAERNNNNSNFSGVACASELYLTTCGNPGMAALILMTLDHISLCHNIGGMPTIFWRNCYTVCPRNASVNAWELFFESVNFKIEDQVKKVFCLGNYLGPEAVIQSHLNIKRSTDKNVERKSLLNLSFRHRDVEGFEGIISRRVRQYANSLIKQYIKVRPNIQQMVDVFFSKYMKGYHVLAVHIRGTDHGDEMEDGKLPQLMTWIKNAEYHFESLPSPKKIFIASDNSESIRKFISEFGDKVIFTKAHRSYNYEGMDSVHLSNIDHYKLGTEVLVDILLMAKCRHFLHAESSVASLVAYFNPDIYTHFLDHIPKEKYKEADKKVPRKSNSNINLHESDNTYSEMLESYECFKENKAYSVCENMAEGKFIDFVDWVPAIHHGLEKT